VLVPSTFSSRGNNPLTFILQVSKTLKSLQNLAISKKVSHSLKVFVIFHEKQYSFLCFCTWFWSCLILHDLLGSWLCLLAISKTFVSQSRWQKGHYVFNIAIVFSSLRKAFYRRTIHTNWSSCSNQYSRCNQYRLSVHTQISKDEASRSNSFHCLAFFGDISRKLKSWTRNHLKQTEDRELFSE